MRWVSTAAVLYAALTYVGAVTADSMPRDVSVVGPSEHSLQALGGFFVTRPAVTAARQLEAATAMDVAALAPKSEQGETAIEGRPPVRLERTLVEGQVRVDSSSGALQRPADRNQVDGSLRGPGDPPPQPCPEDALFGQRCSTLAEDPWVSAMLSDDASGFRTYERFWDVRGDISGLSWHGVFVDEATYSECSVEPATFSITFFEDAAGTPGAEVCSYIVSAYGEPTNGDCVVPGSYTRAYAVDLDPPCTLSDGWVSVMHASESPGCTFYWVGSPVGDGTFCYEMSGEMVCPEPGTNDDMSLCILGSMYPGACCDDLTGYCEDGVEAQDCLEPKRFTPDVLCADLDPPCGQITGACCEADTCMVRTPAECLAVSGVYKGDYVPCDPSPCVGACCLGDHVCEVYLEAECIGLGGDYIGDGTTCDPNPCPTVNDDCAGAEPLGEGTIPFDTTYATLDGPQLCGLGKNVWFCYTASATGTVTVTISQQDYSTWWGPSGAAYDGCACDPFPTLITCDEWGGGQFSFDVLAGAQYLIEIGTVAGGDKGGGVLIDITLDAWPYGACCSEDPPYCSEAFEPQCAGTFGGDGTTCAPTDCNNSGIPDTCDIAMGLSEDCNGNGIPDDCDIRDCDGSIWCDDCDGNGVPDECDAGVPGGIVFQYDDGSAEDSIGVGALVELAWIQHYTIPLGSQYIVSVSTCFGNATTLSGYSGVNPGDQFRVFVWDDPDGDGNPMDAVLLGSATAFADAASIDTDVLQEVRLDPPVHLGGSFFVGAAVASSLYPSPLDLKGEPAHESWITYGWITEGGFNPHAFSADYLDDVWAPGNWLLRVATRPGPSPSDCNGNGIPDDCEICGDLDSDGDVDYDDYVIFLEAFGCVTDGVPAVDYCCDYDGTGAVGMADFDAWLGCYRAYVNDPLAGPPTVGKRRIRVPLSPLPKRGFSPAPSP